MKKRPTSMTTAAIVLAAVSAGVLGNLGALADENSADAGGSVKPAWSAVVPGGGGNRQSTLKVPAFCHFREPPEQFEYDAVGTYQGERLYGDPRFEGLDAVYSVHVQVTSTEHPVVLMLSAFANTLWNVDAAPGVTIAGIVYTGSGRAYVQGALPTRGNVLDFTSGSVCGRDTSASVYNGEGFKRLQELAIAITGSRLSTMQGSYNGTSFYVGPDASDLSNLQQIRAALQQAPVYPENDAVKALVEQGIIRPASGDELFAWMSADPELAEYGLVRDVDEKRPYLVLKPFTFPDGMYGIHSSVFLLPAGMPMPVGDPAHNIIYKMDVSDGCPIRWGKMCRSNW